MSTTALTPIFAASGTQRWTTLRRWSHPTLPGLSWLRSTSNPLTAWFQCTHWTTHYRQWSGPVPYTSIQCCLSVSGWPLRFLTHWRTDWSGTSAGSASAMCSITSMIFLVAGPPGSAECAAALKSLDVAFSSLGVPLAEHKRDGPTTYCLTYLGIEVDMVAGQSACQRKNWSDSEPSCRNGATGKYVSGVSSSL